MQSPHSAHPWQFHKAEASTQEATGVQWEIRTFGSKMPLTDAPQSQLLLPSVPHAPLGMLVVAGGILPQRDQHV